MDLTVELELESMRTSVFVCAVLECADNEMLQHCRPVQDSYFRLSVTVLLGDISAFRR